MLRDDGSGLGPPLPIAGGSVPVVPITSSVWSVLIQLPNAW